MNSDKRNLLLLAYTQDVRHRPQAQADQKDRLGWTGFTVPAYHAAQEVQECPNCLEKGHSEEQCPLFDGQDTWCERCGRNHFGNCATFSLQQNGTRGR